MMIGRDMPHVAVTRATKPGPVRLRLKNLNQPRATRFGTSLTDINMVLRAGQIIGISGISGNGQQELAAVISGEVRASAADMVHIKDQPVGHMGPMQRRRLGFAFVPEERLGRGAIPEMSLADNSLLTAHRRGMLRHGFVRRRVEKAFTGRCIDEFDVRTPGPNAEAGAMSGGNLQKFILGREIMLDPDLMLVSQPTWGVDIGAATAIRRRLIDMRNSGKAILVISEDVEELFEICDILHVLCKGQLSAGLTAAETSAEDIGAYMIGSQI